MERDYYEKYYELERTHWWFTARKKILSDYVRTNIQLDKPLKILNIGAATGATSEMLREFGDVVSIEYDEECIEQTARFLDFVILPGNILELQFPDNSMDLVCAFDVIEHLQQDRLAISEMIRVCKSQGAVMITVPAFMSLWGEHDLVNHHVRRYTVKGLSELFASRLNCRLEYITYFNSRLFPAVFLARTLGRLKKANPENWRSDNEKYRFGPFDRVLYRIFAGESERISKQRPSLMPGVSILVHLTKI